MQLVHRTCVHCMVGGGKYVASYSKSIFGERQTGWDQLGCFRLARAGVQVLKVAAGPVIVTLATVLVAVQQR